MKVLVLVGNNLKYDTRVKRHIKAIAERADEVQVIGRPNGDDNFYLQLPNLTHSFFNWKPFEYPATEKLRNTAENLNVLDDIWTAMPLLLENRYYDHGVFGNSFAFADKLMTVDRWAEMLQGTPEIVTDEQQVGWAMSFVDASIQWADMVSNVKADIVYCNDIDTLLCGVAHKKKYGSRLIYDTHDIFCDMFPGIFPRQHRNLIGRLEKSLLAYADMLISVNDSANRWIKGTYHSNVSAVAILNCTDDIVKASFNAKEPSDKLKIYYHGGCDATRGLENIIKAIALTSDIQLVLRLLPSEYEKTLRQLVKELNLIDRVSFLEPVDSVMSASAAHSDGDIGIHACDNIKCIDLELSLTNKFIEYLRAGLPVITSDVIEQASIVRKYDAGYVLANNSPEEIARVFEIAKSEKSSYKQKSENALRASKELFDWNKYKPLLQKAVFNEFDNDELIKMAEIKPLKAAEKLNETDCLKQELRVWQDEFKRQVLAREYAINVKEQKEIEAQKKEESIIAKYEMQLLQMESIARQKDELLKETTNKYETIVKDKLKEIDNISNILRETQEKNKMQLDEIYASASWKLTKPLRSIARKFK